MNWLCSKNPSLALQWGALDGAIGALCDPNGNAQNFRPK